MKFFIPHAISHWAATVMTCVLFTGSGAHADAPVSSNNKDIFEKTLQSAKTAQAKVAQKKFEWTTVETLIAKAEAFAKAGDYEQAIKAAKEAKLHSELGIRQAEKQDREWQKAVPR